MMAHATSNRQSLPGAEDIFRGKLRNGVTLLSRANFNSPSVVVSGYIQAGGLSDPLEKLGLADFTASALMRGTQKRTTQQIFAALEDCGASLSFGSGAHTTGFSGRCLVEDLPIVLDLLAECLQQPVFPDEQVEKLRAQLLTGLAMRAQDTGDMASLTFDQIVFAGHPYSRPDDGYPETIQAVTRQDLAEFHARQYGPRGAVLSVVGAIQASQALEQVERSLGDWSKPAQPEPVRLPSLAPLRKTTNRKVSIAGKSQSDIVIGCAGPSRRDSGFHAASLGNSILGQFGMMGRIGEVVRERSGLAYSAYSSLNAGLGPGSWEVSAGVNPRNVEKVIRLIRQELERFIGKGVTPDELADSRANYIGRLPLSMESNAGVAGALLNIERFNLGLDYYREYAHMLGAVTPENVLETARQYLHPEALAIATAGP